jgi:hypothetical protein
MIAGARLHVTGHRQGSGAGPMSDLTRLTVWDDRGDRCQNVFERHCLHQAAARRANVLVAETVPRVA